MFLMIPNDDFSNRFELYELHDFINAKKTRHLLEDEFEEVEQALYDDISPVMTYYDYDLGRCFKKGTSTEDHALWIIEQKDVFIKLIDKCRKREDILDEAMSTLTPRERDAISVIYFNRKNDLGLSKGFFNEILIEAQRKLCTVISEKQQQQREKAEEDRKQQLKMKAQQWSVVG
jgi:hypothetical protein